MHPHINNLLTRLNITLYLQIAGFTPVSAEVFDAVNNLQSAFRKIENKRKSNKQDNRQGTLNPFMKK